MPLPKLLWCDLETTGLDPQKDNILEIGLIVTNEDLEIVDEMGLMIGHKEFPYMADEVLTMHRDNHLLDLCRLSNLTIAEATGMVTWLQVKHFGEKKIKLAGSNVHFDRAFLKAQMPAFEKHLHFRNFDMCSVRTFKKWDTGEEFKRIPKLHRALADLRANIRELRFLLGWGE